MRTRTLIASVAGWLITFAVPVILVLGSVRLVMTPQFLSFEYHRPDMPADVFGFTLEDRLRWGPLGIEYLLTDANISLLGDLRFPEGGALFTARELGHMQDVKSVTQAAFNVLTISVAFVSMCIVGLIAAKRGADVRSGLFRGAVFTLGAILAVVIGAVVAWDVFFTLFHQTFFADGTWIFLTSDTLIRLYPEKFWFDAALVIGVLTVGGTLLIIGVTWRSWRRSVRVPDAGAEV